MTFRKRNSVWLGLFLGLVTLPVVATDPAPDPEKRISQFVHDAWQVEDGLPSNDVLAMVESQDGYLWLATRGGLARFDGVRFTVFNIENTKDLTSDDLGALVEGPDGSLWIASRGGGLFRFHRGRWTGYPAPTPAANDMRALAFDREGTLWIGTLGGLWQWREERLIKIEDPRVVNADVRSLHEDANGALWIGSLGQGAVYRQHGRFNAVTTAEGLSNNQVDIAYPAADGTVWIGTSQGLNQLREGEVRVLTQADGLVDDDVTDLLQDSAGSLWIATDKGFSRFRDGRFDNYAFRADLSADLVRSLLVDRDGTLWVGTYGSGLHRFKDGRITAFTTQEGLSHNKTWAFYEHSDELLVGLDLGGVDRIRDGRVEVFLSQEDLLGADTYSVLVDRSGTTWAGTSQGLVRFDGNGLRWFTTADGLGDPRVRIVYEDPVEPGVLWLGTVGGGLHRWSDGAIQRLDTSAGLSHDNVRAIYRDAAGDLWVGTEIGLNRVRGQEVTVFTTADGLSSNAMRCFYEVPGGDLWIGTRGGGLTRYRDGTFTTYTSRDGLPHNDIWAIVEDEAQNLWWSSDQGITRARLADFDAFDQGRVAAVPTRSFGRADGMKTVECNGVGYPAGFKTSDGMLWFASAGGAVRVDPRREPSPPPPIYIESLFANQAPVDLATAIQLAPGQEDLEIRYTALHLQDAERLSFRYRLEGYDQDWVEVGTRRSAFYTHLPPGSYTFRVAAKSHESDGHDAEASIKFALAPRFYESWWFRLLVVGALGLIGNVGYQIRTRTIRERNRRLTAEISQRRQAEAERERFVAELEAKNAELERFVYTVSHDLKSPIVTIKGFIGLLLQDAESGDLNRLRHDAERIAAAAEKMRRLLDELLELSRIGRQLNSLELVDLGGLAREAGELVVGVLDAHGVELSIASDLPRVSGDRVRLLEVYQNLFENAARFMGDEPTPRIEAGVRRQDGESVLYVRDNGIGIEPRYHDKVFGLFERLDPETEGTGVGLALVKRIVEMHGGRIWIESRGEGSGTTFCFTLAPVLEGHSSP